MVARGFTQRFWPSLTPEYKVEATPRGLILSLNGAQLITSSILDRGYFVNKWFAPHELEIAARFEDSTQQILNQLGPRTYSGLYPYSHIDRVAKNAFETAKAATIPLDFIILLTIIGHDRIEDDTRVREKLSEWEQAVIKGETERRISLEQQLREVRSTVKDEIGRELLGYVPATGVKGSVKATLEAYIENAVRLIINLTRFSNELPYALSMGNQYRRYPKEDIVQTLRRAFVKNNDRIANMEENGLIDAQIMKQLEIAFKDGTLVGTYAVSDELKRRFGGVQAGKEMPASVRVNIAFESLFPLHYQNETINRYVRGIVSGGYGKKGARLAELLRLVELSRTGMIAATLKLADSAIAIYESDRGVSSIKPDVDKEIERKKEGTFYDRVTLHGFVKDWLLYGAGGSEFISSLDSTLEQRRINYIVARHIVEELPRFAMFYDPNNTSNGKPVLMSDSALYDPRRHLYFTLGGVDGLMRLMPDFWELVATLKKPSGEKKIRGLSNLLF